MKNKKYSILVLVALLAGLVPARAVFKEKNLKQTLSVLHYELADAYAKLVRTSARISESQKKQRETLIDLVENCNELSLMLYSQPQDFTFDLTYALDEVTTQYMQFVRNRIPYNDVVTHLEGEITRYEKLKQTLKNLAPALKEGEAEAASQTRTLRIDTLEFHSDTLGTLPSFMETDQNPFILDSLGQAERDSCLLYATMICDTYWSDLFAIDEDNSYYLETDAHLKEAYDYAQDRYRMVQKRIFIDGQSNYLNVLKHLRRHFRRAVSDCREKYGTALFHGTVHSEWRGPMVIGLVFFVVFYILLATLLSNLIIRGLARKVPAFQTQWFREHRLLLILLLGVVLFAISIMIADIGTHQHFIRMASGLLAEFAWMLAAIFVSLLIRMDGSQGRHALKTYLPIILLGLIIIVFRIVFIPNTLILILFPPILLGFTLWQYFFSVRKAGQLPQIDRIYMRITFGVLLAATVISWSGYVLMALLVTVWWIFQMTVLQTITALSHLLKRYYDSRVSKRISAYINRNPNLPLHGKGAFIEVSWLYDFVRMVLVPVACIASVPACLLMAGNIFDLGSVVMKVFGKTFLSIPDKLDISLLKVGVILAIYYLFRYLVYAAKAFFRVWKTRLAVSKLSNGIVFKESDINFNLADNLISLVGWALFAIISLVLLDIPMTAITIITTGLATGIGFAMKDVLNNFFYGIQLMSGRLRVGDVIECDGIRGTVDSLSYQSTVIQSVDGSLIAFPNSSLFSKNFKNLTRNNAYELLRIPVGVKYGTDIEKVRSLIIEALKPLQTKDKYGRDIVDRKRGVTVRLDDFGDNSVNLIVSQFTTVEMHYIYAARAKEIIYETLNANGIEIPFPQRDVYIKEVDSPRPEAE